MVATLNDRIFDRNCILELSLIDAASCVLTQFSKDHYEKILQIFCSKKDLNEWCALTVYFIINY